MSASLQNEATRRPEVSPALMARPGLVLRKCACGGAAGMSGDCPECSEKRLSLQRKVSRPGDELELEADRIAEQVMGSLRQPSPSQRRSAAALGNSLVQRSDLDKDSIYRQASADESPQSTAPAPTPAPTPSPPTVHSPPGPAATTATAQPASAGLIVEDDAREIASGQMRKSQFLDELKSAVCSAADAELAAVGRSAQGCPYIENWINHYRSKDSRYVERALHKYAPEAAGITSARDYIPIVSNRIQRSVSVWARTGQITGVPDELAGQLPGGGLPGAIGGLISRIGNALGGLAFGTGSAASSIAGGIGTAVSGAGSLFFKSHDEGPKEADPEQVRSQLGPGQPLDGGLKSRMESAFGHDFSQVRVHNDPGAVELSASLNARAFTIGNHVAFGSAEYQPGTIVGDALIAHELAHVTQQTGSGSIARGTDSSLEVDADISAARAILSSRSVHPPGTSGYDASAIPSGRTGLRLQRCSRGSGAAAGSPTVVVGHFRNTGSTADSGENNCRNCPRELGVHAGDWHNGMEVRGDITGHRADAAYDFKRTKERATWEKVGGSWTQTSHVGPGEDDDRTNDDESLTPVNNHIYSEDIPGPSGGQSPSDDPTATELVYRASFVEFVNVQVGTGGWSKQSNDFQWHSVTWLEKAGGTWQRKAGANEIETGATTVGTGNP
jgi:hypothetical protein